MASEFSEHHGKAAMKVIGATLIAALIFLPIVNKFLGSIVPKGTIQT